MSSGLRILLVAGLAVSSGFGQFGLTQTSGAAFQGSVPQGAPTPDRLPLSLADDPEHSRPYFAGLRELAERYGLEHLSMGTSQDYLVAVQEGATIVRLGTTLYADAS